MKQKKADDVKLVRITRHIHQYQKEWLDWRNRETGVPDARLIRDAIDLLIKKTKDET